MVKIYNYLVYIAAFILFFVGVFLYSPQKSDGTDAKGLFEVKCSMCHNIERPKSKKKSHEAWKITVMRMKNVNGCPINDDEAEKIIKYLSENYGNE